MNTKNPNENEWEQCELNTQPRDYESLHGIASPSDNRDSLGNPTPPAPAGNAKRKKSYKSCQRPRRPRQRWPESRWLSGLPFKDISSCTDLGALAGLPSATVDPGEAFIYFLISGNCIVYVGQSVGKSAFGRIRDHLRGDKAGKFDRAVYCPVPVPRVAGIEMTLIRRLRPELNKQVHRDPSRPKNRPKFPAIPMLCIPLSAAGRQAFRRHLTWDGTNPISGRDRETLDILDAVIAHLDRPRLPLPATPAQEVTA